MCTSAECVGPSVHARDEAVGDLLYVGLPGLAMLGGAQNLVVPLSRRHQHHVVQRVQPTCVVGGVVVVVLGAVVVLVCMRVIVVL